MNPIVPLFTMIRTLSFLLTLALVAIPGFAQSPAAAPSSEQKPKSIDVDSGIQIRIGSFSESSSEFVRVGSPVHVRTNQTAPEVVVVNSSAVIDGQVESDVVVLMGKAVINGHVHGDVVGIGSGIVLGPGARVDGDAVSVIGRVELGPDSRVGGDAVGLGGGVEKAETATIDGDLVNENWNGLIRLGALGWPEWLTKSFTELVVLARPLSLKVRWVWVVALLFFVLHLLVILVAPRANRAVVGTVANRGATAFLMGLVALPFGCLAALLLVPTVIGILALPFLLAGVVCLGIAGKSGVLQHLGGTLTARFQNDGIVRDSISMVHELAEPLDMGDESRTPAVAQLALGSVLVSLLYIVPFVGLTLWMALTVWALGAGSLTLLEGFRSESKGTRKTRPGPISGSETVPPPTPRPTPAPMLWSKPVVAPEGLTPEPPSTAIEASPAVTPPLPPSMTATSESIPEPGMPPSRPAPALASGPDVPHVVSPEIPEALSLPRVALKERILASLIDLVGVSFLSSLTGPLMPPFVPMIAYFVGFWVWKQTTLGGIIVRIRVVRLDGRKVDFPTAIVRSLGAFLGLAALGLGYFWAAWDEERQGWHDKLAGTVVVRVPKAQSLV